jgi:hypothetical protein
MLGKISGFFLKDNIPQMYLRVFCFEVGSNVR